MKLRTLLAAVALGLATVTGCATTDEPARLPVDTIADQPQPEPAVEPDQHTRNTFNLTWAGASEAERNAYCMSVAVLPEDEAAAEMQRGAGGSTDLDWPLMVELLRLECAGR
ncbi:hypothetical protein ACFWR9_08905 [Streptomyces sp. NPDC058534]|uniref:hypothetical protein n=1 Tax=Streptomyces sp. NPDC058534 TaxID=3346541 RepID=UPI0036504498